MSAPECTQSHLPWKWLEVHTVDHAKCLHTTDSWPSPCLVAAAWSRLYTQGSRLYLPEPWQAADLCRVRHWISALVAIPSSLRRGEVDDFASSCIDVRGDVLWPSPPGTPSEDEAFASSLSCCDTSLLRISAHSSSMCPCPGFS